MLYREFFKYIKDNFKKQYPNAEKITAIVTYPVKFSQSQITDTVKSAQEVFDVVFCLTEPLAATIPYVDTYRNSKKSKAPEKETLMIIDLGGGTLDINFVEIDGKKIKRLDEIPQTGDLKVGGDV
jgi:molecular chaperone DnaK (HSP70)